MFGFKRKTSKELAEELQELKRNRTRVEGKATLEKQIREEKKRISEARYGGLKKGISAAGKVIGKGLDTMQENMIREEQKRKKEKKGRYGMF